MTTHAYVFPSLWKVPSPVILPWQELPDPRWIGRPLAIDHRKLEKAARVAYIGDFDASYLFDVVKFYFENRDGNANYREHLQCSLRRRDAGRRLYGSAQVEVCLFDVFVERRTHAELTSPQWRTLLLSTTIALIQGAWYQCGGRGEGTAHYRKLADYGGPLIDLFQELCNQLHIPIRERPGPHTIHRARVLWCERRNRFSVLC